MVFKWVKVAGWAGRADGSTHRRLLAQGAQHGPLRIGGAVVLGKAGCAHITGPGLVIASRAGQTRGGHGGRGRGAVRACEASACRACGAWGGRGRGQGHGRGLQARGKAKHSQATAPRVRVAQASDAAIAAPRAHASAVVEGIRAARCRAAAVCAASAAEAAREGGPPAARGAVCRAAPKVAAAPRPKAWAIPPSKLLPRVALLGDGPRLPCCRAPDAVGSAAAHCLPSAAPRCALPARVGRKKGAARGVGALPGRARPRGRAARLRIAPRGPAPARSGHLNPLPALAALNGGAPAALAAPAPAPRVVRRASAGTAAHGHKIRLAAALGVAGRAASPNDNAQQLARLH